MQLQLTHAGTTATVTSERAARAWARAQLGCARVTETPTETGWQYWDRDNESDDAVTVVVK